MTLLTLFWLRQCMAMTHHDCVQHYNTIYVCKLLNETMPSIAIIHFKHAGCHDFEIFSVSQTAILFDL